jgi:hypothetical protein
VEGGLIQKALTCFRRQKKSKTSQKKEKEKKKKKKKKRKKEKEKEKEKKNELKPFHDTVLEEAAHVCVRA